MKRQQKPESKKRNRAAGLATSSVSGQSVVADERRCIEDVYRVCRFKFFDTDVNVSMRGQAVRRKYPDTEMNYYQALPRLNWI